MKTLASLLTSLVLAIWVVAIAIISVQNATPVALSFLTFRTIQIPIGLVLAFSAGIGIVGTAMILPLWSLPGGRTQSDEDLDAEFSFDE